MNKQKNSQRIWSSQFGHYVYIALLILITSIIYSNTLDNTYHLDSVYRVQNNTEIDKFWPPIRFFTDVRTGSTNPKIAEFRPLMPLSHAINSEIAQFAGIGRLAGFHIGNIAIHICSTILVYFLSCILISGWGGTAGPEMETIHFRHKAFVAALIFAVHPISGSAVNYIAARDLLLMVFFFLAAMLVYFHMRMKGDTIYGWVSSLLLICLAILSKQAAIIAFGLVFLFEWLLAKQGLLNWRLWLRTVIFSLPTAGYFLLYSFWIVQKNPSDSLRTLSGITYPLTMLKVHLFYYLRNFVWPFQMRALAEVEMVDTVFNPAALIGLVFILFTLLAACFFYKRQPLLTFFIFAYWLLFSLTSSFFPFQFVVTDYRQYMPLVFLSMTFTLLLFLWTRKTVALTIVTGMVLYFSLSSWFMNRHWKTEESFWEQSIKYGARPLAHNNYGLAVTRKDPELSEYHFKKALEKSPYHIYTNINLGMLYLRQEKTAEGMKILRNVVRLNPNWALSHYWLSVGLKSVGQKQEYVSEAKRAADLDPRSFRYQYSAAKALQDAGRYQEAIPYFERIIKINPAYNMTEFWLGFALQKNGQSEEAIDMYSRFLRRKPDHVQGHFNLGYELMVVKKCTGAVEHFNKVLELRPSYKETHLYLSRCYKILRDEEMADRHIRKYREK